MLGETLLIRRGLYPSRASETAITHNKTFHPEEGMAHIYTDETIPLFWPNGHTRLPMYKVVCDECVGPIIAGTGHRPNKVGGNYNRLVDLAAAAIDKLKPSWIISGMALGWDLALAQAAVNAQCKWIAAMPFPGYEERWTPAWTRYLKGLIGKANSAVYVSQGEYSPRLYQVRNEWMVNRATLVLALWDCSPGGTANTVQYAQSLGVRVINTWKAWIKYGKAEAHEG